MSRCFSFYGLSYIKRRWVLKSFCWVYMNSVKVETLSRRDHNWWPCLSPSNKTCRLWEHQERLSVVYPHRLLSKTLFVKEWAINIFIFLRRYWFDSSNYYWVNIWFIKSIIISFYYRFFGPRFDTYFLSEQTGFVRFLTTFSTMNLTFPPTVIECDFYDY